MVKTFMLQFLEWSLVVTYRIGSNILSFYSCYFIYKICTA